MRSSHVVLLFEALGFLACSGSYAAAAAAAQAHLGDPAKLA